MSAVFKCILGLFIVMCLVQFIHMQDIQPDPNFPNWMPNAGYGMPNAANGATKSANCAPNTANCAPTTANCAPNAANEAPKSANCAPNAPNGIEDLSPNMRKTFDAQLNHIKQTLESEAIKNIMAVGTQQITGLLEKFQKAGDGLKLNTK